MVNADGCDETGKVMDIYSDLLSFLHKRQAQKIFCELANA